MASEELQLDQQLRATTQCWSWKLLLGSPPPLELPPATCRCQMDFPWPDATPIAIATRVWKLEQLMGCMTDGHGMRLHVHMYERQGACVSARTYRTHARRIWNVMLCIKKLASNACTCTYTCMLQHDFLCVRAAATNCAWELLAILQPPIGCSFRCLLSCILSCIAIGHAVAKFHRCFAFDPCSAKKL